MLKIRSTLLLLAILFSAAGNAFSWTEPKRLTNKKGDSLYPQVASYKSNVYVVWEDAMAGGNRDIMFRRSSDNGQTWKEEQRIGWSGDGSKPKMAINEENIHIIWLQGNQPKIYYIRSTDKGNKWSKPFFLGECGDYKDIAAASLFVNKNNVYLVWNYLDVWANDDGLYYRTSNDGGLNWGKISKIAAELSGPIRNPTVAAYENTVHVAWQDKGTPYGSFAAELLYTRSVNNGKNWAKPKLIKSFPDWQLMVPFYPILAINGLTVHLIWNETGGGNSRIYHKRTIDGGKSWTKNKVICSSANDIAACSVALDSKNIHMVWYGTGGSDIYYLNSDDNGNSWNPKEVLSGTDECGYPIICIYKGKAHVVWQENLYDWWYSGYFEIFYTNNSETSKEIYGGKQ